MYVCVCDVYVWCVCVVCGYVCGCDVHVVCVCDVHAVCMPVCVVWCVCVCVVWCGLCGCGCEGACVYMCYILNKIIQLLNDSNYSTCCPFQFRIISGGDVIVLALVVSYLVSASSLVNHKGFYQG